MKKSLIIFLGGILCFGGCAPVYGPGYGPAYGSASSAGFVVAVGDQPYYNRGPYYVERGRRYVFVRGQRGQRRGHRIWIPGRYVVR